MSSRSVEKWGENVSCPRSLPPYVRPSIGTAEADDEEGNGVNVDVDACHERAFGRFTRSLHEQRGNSDAGS